MLFTGDGDHRELHVLTHSVPTRRSSDLPNRDLPEPGRDCPLCPRLVSFRHHQRAAHPDWHNAPVLDFGDPDAWLAIVGLAPGRSEEHTSELQSLMRISYAVFCLKKKKHTL